MIGSDLTVLTLTLLPYKNVRINVMFHNDSAKPTKLALLILQVYLPILCTLFNI